MDTQTLDDTRTEDLTDYEFETTCDVKVALNIGPLVIRLLTCTRPGWWIANFPCCGRPVVACKLHAKNAMKIPWRCGPCDTPHENLLEWRPLNA